MRMTFDDLLRVEAAVADTGMGPLPCFLTEEGKVDIQLYPGTDYATLGSRLIAALVTSGLGVVCCTLGPKTIIISKEDDT